MPFLSHGRDRERERESYIGIITKINTRAPDDITNHTTVVNHRKKLSLPAAFILFFYMPEKNQLYDVFIDIQEWLHGQKYAMTFDHKYATTAGMNGGKRIYFIKH